MPANKQGAVALIFQLPIGQPSGPAPALGTVKQHIAGLNQWIIQVAQNSSLEHHAAIKLIIRLFYKALNPLRVIELLETAQGQQTVSQSAMVVKARAVYPQQARGGSQPHLLGGVILHALLAIIL